MKKEGLSVKVLITLNKAFLENGAGNLFGVMIPLSKDHGGKVKGRARRMVLSIGRRGMVLACGRRLKEDGTFKAKTRFVDISKIGRWIELRNCCRSFKLLGTCYGEEDILASLSGCAYASDYLSPHLKCTDDLVRLHAYWARLELNLNKDLVAARGVWESLLKNSGSMFGAWQGYIAMELEAGHINEARSIYKRCYSKRFAGTGSECGNATLSQSFPQLYALAFHRNATVNEVWNSNFGQGGWNQRFSRGFNDWELDLIGDLLTMLRDFRISSEEDSVIWKVVRVLWEIVLALFGIQWMFPETVKEVYIGEESSSLIGFLEWTYVILGCALRGNLAHWKIWSMLYERSDRESHKKNAREKRKSSSSRTDEQPPAKWQKDTAQNPKNGKGRIELENIVASNEEQELKAKDDKPDDTNKRQMKGPSHEKNNDVGGVTAIRILKDKFTGKSRGLAYVDFSDDAHLAAAVAKNKKMLRGKRLSIARSDPKQKGKKGSADPSNHTGQVMITGSVSYLLHVYLCAVSKGAGHSNDQTGTVGESDSKESGQISSSKAPQARRDDNFQLKGRNTFAVPRNVRPLGWIDNKKKTEEETDEMPKSNDEFRKMLLKSCVRQERSEICIFRILKLYLHGRLWQGLEWTFRKRERTGSQQEKFLVSNNMNASPTWSSISLMAIGFRLLLSHPSCSEYSSCRGEMKLPCKVKLTSKAEND
ncbi:hypothetical protein CK203_071078 [Vitis vinifera]|uniref:RRM domain-containing protein n=1 Tax=Vitis vinifera TaxID=29760 RepID=A0A438E9E8_VITVI|nr:hypothetical protein CK203_071078 [Vitis vinifera]